MIKSLIFRIFLISLISLIPLIVWFAFLAPAGTDKSLEIVSFPDNTSKILVASKLKQSGFIKSEIIFELLLTKDPVLAGGYQLSKSMNIFEVAKKMVAGPQLLWVVVPPGWRKEQLAEKLQIKFKWTAKDTQDFLSFPEGEYLPDTYLVPKNESGEQVGKRMINRFNEAFAPYAPQFLTANIKNDTAIKIASLLERESGGSDMTLIAGIIWNRLNRGMGLKIDATIQYAKGKVGDQWWAPVSVADYSSVDSLYNTYLHKGLPPTPIASPGVPAIEAVLNPVETDCLYYLHDPAGLIHCSVTYEEHLKNIREYL